MIDHVETGNPYSTETAYAVKQKLKHQGVSDETTKHVMEHKKLKVDRFTKTGKKGVVIVGTAGKPDYVDAFDLVKREAKILAKLHHPNIVEISDLRVSGDGQEITLVEPLLEGETFEDTIKILGDGEKSLKIKLQIMRQVAKALDYCHSQGIVYGDMKRQSAIVNLIRGETGEIELERVTLVDFGLAIDTKHPHPLDGSYANDRFASYEQQMDQRREGYEEAVKNPLSDYQSFGAVMYEFLTGEHPIKCQSFLPTFIQANPDYLVIDKVPTEVQPLMKKILSLNPEERKETGNLESFVIQVEKMYEENKKNVLLSEIRSRLEKT